MINHKVLEWVLKESYMNKIYLLIQNKQLNFLIKSLIYNKNM